MKEHFKEQLQTGNPLTFAMLSGMNASRKERKSPLLSIDRIGKTLVYFMVEYVVGVTNEGTTMRLEMLKEWNDRFDKTMEQYEFSRLASSSSMPILKLKDAAQ